MTGRERGDYERPSAAGDGNLPGKAGPDVAQRFGDEASMLRQQQYAMRMASDRRALAQQPDYKAVTNPDGTVSVNYNDGSSVKVDSWQTKRPIEFINTQGDKTTLKYEGASNTPASYKIVDREGKVKEEGSKGPKDAEFTVKQFRDGKEVTGKEQHIVDIRLTPDGQLDYVGKDGLHNQRLRSGSELRRDPSGRILSEVTPGQRLTEYSYEGNNLQPLTFTVKDAGGNIVRHGVKGENGWNVYQPAAGEKSLDPKNLEDSTKISKDPINRVTDVQINQTNGMRVEMHANNDRTWSTDKHDYRMNPSGNLMVLDKLPDGKQRLVSFRDSNGVRTSYGYDSKGELSSETREYLNGQKRALVRQGEGDDWKNSDGKVVKCNPKVLADGSVQMTYPEKNFVFTQSASGSELVHSIGKDGQARLVHSTDTLGREIQFTYANDGKLNKMEISRIVAQPGQPPFRQTLVWERTGETKEGDEVWETGNRKHKFVGSHRFQEDGSLVRSETGKDVDTVFSVRGVTYEQPKTKQPEEKKPDEKKPEVKQPEEKKPDEKKPEVKKPEVKKPEVKKVEEKKSEEPDPEDDYDDEDDNPGDS
jgi:YD repeat-containing protein